MHVDIYGERILAIAECVCKFYGITVNKMRARDRKGEIVKARQITQYLCREQLNGCPYSIIGYMTGIADTPYDHNTVRNSCNKTRSKLYLKTALGKYINNDFRNEYQRVRGIVLFKLSNMDSSDTATNDKIYAHVGKATHERLSLYCQSTGTTMSAFIRSAVTNELNRISNGIQV